MITKQSYQLLSKKEQEKYEVVRTCIQLKDGKLFWVVLES